MSTSNKFQHRLDKIRGALVKHTANLDNRLFIQTEGLTVSPSEFVFRHVMGCVWAVTSDGAFVRAFMHDGSSRNNGGFGGEAFSLKMADGSLKEFVGPWSGRPAIWATWGAPHSIKVHINEDPYVASYYAGDIQWATKDFVDAIIDKFNLPYRTELVWPNGGKPDWAGNPDEETLVLVSNNS